MSDDDRDIDIESDEENDSDTGTISQRHNNSFNTQAEKRAHHNALERKRRDHIKESFTSLREAVPSLKGEKASRAQILKKTTECIQNMRHKIHINQREVEDIRKQNAMLEEEIRQLENAKSNCLVLDTSDYSNTYVKQEPQQDMSDGEEQDFRRSKKMRTSPQ